MEENKIDQVIANLSKIEATATKIREDAEIEKTSYTEYIEGEIKKFDEEFEAKTDKQMKELADNLEKTQKKELADMRVEILKYVDKMETDFNNNFKQIAQDIFEKIVKE